LINITHPILTEDVVTRKTRNAMLSRNVEPALHAHVVPRYVDEAPQLATAHPWMYDWNAAPRFDVARDAQLLQDLRSLLVAGAR
jgi:hypothetical protein